MLPAYLIIGNEYMKALPRNNNKENILFNHQNEINSKLMIDRGSDVLQQPTQYRNNQEKERRRRNAPQGDTHEI